MLQKENVNLIQALIVRVGSSNRFQYRMFMIFALKWLFTAMYLMSPNFLFYTADFTCLNGENGNNDCNEWVCTHGNQDFWKQHLTELPKSLSYEFGFYICGREWVTSLIQSLIYWGSFVGYLVFPFVADNFGRKKSESISWCIAAAGAILLACSFNIVMAGIGLFLCGLGSNSAINLHYTFIKEFVIGRARDIMIISLQITFSLGVCAIAFVAMLIPNWRIITICFFAVPMLLLVFTYRFVEETPEFNIIQGLQTFTNSLNRIARVNKRSELELQDVEQSLKGYSRDSQKLTLISLFKYKSLRLTSYCCGIVNMAIEFIYDGTLFNLNRVGLNLYTNQMIIGAAEMVAAMYANFIVFRVRRKRYTIAGLILIGVLLTVFIFTGYKTDSEEQDITKATIQLVVLILMRFVLSSLWGFYFVYLSELYPSEITSISYGYMSAVGSLAASASPYIKLATKDSSMIVMAGMAFIAAGHVGCLRQTKGQPTRLRVKERDDQPANKLSIISVASD